MSGSTDTSVCIISDHNSDIISNAIDKIYHSTPFARRSIAEDVSFSKTAETRGKVMAFEMRII